MSLARITLALTLAAIAMACSGSSIPTAPLSTALRGTLTDPAGDALVSPTLTAEAQVPPDLVSAEIDVENGNLTITVSYAPGTLSQARTVFFADLDLDENPMTGFAIVPTGPGTSEVFGWEYEIQAVMSPNSNQAAILRSLSAVSSTTIATTSVSFPTSDQARVTVPLTLLGGDDGRLRFRVTCAQFSLTQKSSLGASVAIATDFMPSAGGSVGVVR